VAYSKEPEDLVVRLCRKYEDGPNGCMNWTGHVGQNGYGQIGVGSRRDGTGRAEYAHRLSAHLFKGFDLNSPLCVLHKCDNPRCINPDHLFIGTHADNRVDCVSKGRHNPPVGERGGLSKLTDDDVRDIRRFRANGAQIKDIAKEYGLCCATVGEAVRRQTWKHIA